MVQKIDEVIGTINAIKSDKELMSDSGTSSVFSLLRKLPLDDVVSEIFKRVGRAVIACGIIRRCTAIIIKRLMNILNVGRVIVSLRLRLATHCHLVFKTCLQNSIIRKTNSSLPSNISVPSHGTLYSIRWHREPIPVRHLLIYLLYMC